MPRLGRAAPSLNSSSVIACRALSATARMVAALITVISAATILGVALSALQAMTEEEFTDGTSRLAGPSWPRKLPVTRRTRGRRPAPHADREPVSSS